MSSDERRQLIATTVRDGREVSGATAWWLDNPPAVTAFIDYTRLYCIHNVSLDRACRACEPRLAA